MWELPLPAPQHCLKANELPLSFHNCRKCCFLLIATQEPSLRYSRGKGVDGERRVFKLSCHRRPFQEGTIYTELSIKYGNEVGKVWGEAFQGGNSKCKDPEVGTQSGSREEARVARAEWASETVVGDKVEHWAAAGAWSIRRLHRGVWVNNNFLLNVKEVSISQHQMTTAVLMSNWWHCQKSEKSSLLLATRQRMHWNSFAKWGMSTIGRLFALKTSPNSSD